MAPRPDVSEERKQQILDAAIIVFARQGFHKARMDDIAEEVGLSKGSLYWYFKSKDEIILTLMNHLFMQEAEELNDLLAAELSASERLSLLSEHMTEMFQDRFADVLPIVYEYYASAVRQEEVLAFLRTYFAGYLELIAAFVQPGIDSGEFRADINAKEISFMFASFWEGLAFLWFIEQRKTDLNHMSVTMMKVLLAGLQAKN